MNVIRRLAPFLLCLLLTACGGDSEPEKANRGARADLGADPQAQETDDGTARYTPPAGVWFVRSESLAPGEWYEDYRSEDSSALLRVHVFPIRASRAPGAVVGLAVDAFLRSVGTHGFGTGGTRSLSVWGAPGAEASWQAVVKLEPVRGEARLLRISDTKWAFAIGFVPKDATGDEAQRARAFAQSLEPVRPIFYARRFADPELERVEIKPRDEEPVLRKDLHAVALVLEAGVGARFPLSVRKAVHTALRKDLQEEDPTTRKGYRDSGTLFEQLADKPADERLQTLEAVGQRALQGLRDRAKKGYEPAMRYAVVWRRVREYAVGTKEDGLTVGDARCLHELSAFLASLAADREVKPSVERGNRIVAKLKERWPKLAAAEKDALRTMGTTWAALRRDWDQAHPEARRHLRWTAYLALVGPEAVGTTMVSSEARKLMERMQRVKAEDLDALVLHAAQLPAQGLMQVLGALRDTASTGWELGW